MKLWTEIITWLLVRLESWLMRVTTFTLRPWRNGGGIFTCINGYLRYTYFKASLIKLNKSHNYFFPLGYYNWDPIKAPWSGAFFTLISPKWKVLRFKMVNIVSCHFVWNKRENLSHRCLISGLRRRGVSLLGTGPNELLHWYELTESDSA